MERQPNKSWKVSSVPLRLLANLNMNLKNQRVFIIGGTAGIGFAVAKLAIEEGASVLVASGTQQRVDLAVEQRMNSIIWFLRPETRYASRNRERLV